MATAEELVRRSDLRLLATHLLGEPKGTGKNQSWPSPDQALPQTGATPPMTIFVGRDGKERFTCWSTGIKGDALDLIREVKRLDVKEAIEFLRNWNGIPTPDAAVWKLTPKQELLATQAELERFLARSQNAMNAAKKPAAVTEWLTSHGLNKTAAAAAGVGVVIRATVPTHKYPVQLGVALPNYALDNTVVGAQIRLLNSRGIKYLDVRTPARETAVSYHRPRVRHSNGTVVVCEGVADAVVMATEGYPSIAVLATSRLAGAAEAIGEAARGRKILCAFDGDAAGRRSQQTLIADLRTAGLEVAELTLPDGQDIATMKAHSPQWLRTHLDGYRIPARTLGAISI